MVDIGHATETKRVSCVIEDDETIFARISP